MKTDKIMEWIVGFEEWCEENKKQFIKKNNPKLYKKLYGKNITNTNYKLGRK